MRCYSHLSDDEREQTSLVSLNSRAFTIAISAWSRKDSAPFRLPQDHSWSLGSSFSCISQRGKTRRARARQARTRDARITAAPGRRPEALAGDIHQRHAIVTHPRSSPCAPYSWYCHSLGK
jgi:hypothetical protein